MAKRIASWFEERLKRGRRKEEKKGSETFNAEDLVQSAAEAEPTNRKGSFDSAKDRNRVTTYPPADKSSHVPNLKSSFKSSVKRRSGETREFSVYDLKGTLERRYKMSDVKKKIVDFYQSRSIPKSRAQIRKLIMQIEVIGLAHFNELLIQKYGEGILTREESEVENRYIKSQEIGMTGISTIVPGPERNEQTQLPPQRAPPDMKNPMAKGTSRLPGLATVGTEL